MIDFNSYINFIVLFFINRNQALNFVFKFKKKKKRVNKHKSNYH